MSRAFAAGRTFSSRTLKAEWAARYQHTSVVDAVSGAIYVIGGNGGSGRTDYNDVWASTDGGARAGLGRGGGRGVTLGGYYEGTTGVLRVLKGTTWRYCRGTTGGTQRYYRGTRGY